MMCRLFGVLFAALVFMQSSADAALVLRFGQNGVAGLTNFTAQVGSTLNLEIYLVQTSGSTELNDFGLSLMGIDLRVDTGGGSTTGEVSHVTPPSFVFNPGMSDERFTEVLNQDRRLIARAAAPLADALNYAPVMLPAGQNQLLLGTAQLRIGLNSVVGDNTYNLSVRRQDSLSFAYGNNPLGDGSEGEFFNPGIANSTLTLTAVPEPSSVAVLGMMGVAGVARAVRRRRNKVVA